MVTVSTRTAAPPPSRAARPPKLPERARAMFARLTVAARTLRPAFRRLAALGMAAALAAVGLLPPQPAAADTRYDVQVTFNSVTFSDTQDGCIVDDWWGVCVPNYDLEVYGSLTAFTSAFRGGHDGYRYRNFGTWGQLAPGCSGDGVPWTSNSGGACPKSVEAQKIVYEPQPWTGPETYLFQDLLLCASGVYNTCDSRGYSKNNNTIALQLHPGETITVSVDMKELDMYWNSDNNKWVAVPRYLCTGQKSFGPYTAAQLQALNTSGTILDSVHGYYHGSGGSPNADYTAKCNVHFSVKKV